MPLETNTASALASAPFLLAPSPTSTSTPVSSPPCAGYHRRLIFILIRVKPPSTWIPDPRSAGHLARVTFMTIRGRHTLASVPVQRIRIGPSSTAVSAPASALPGTSNVHARGLGFFWCPVHCRIMRLCFLRECAITLSMDNIHLS